MRSSPLALPVLAWALLGREPLAAQQYAALAAAQGLGELAARDARLSFTAASAARARAVLANPPADVGERAVAVMALGAARSLADLARVESLAADGMLTERRAACFALGELGAPGLPALENGLRAGTVGIEEALVVGLVHALGRGTEECAERIETLALDDTDLGLAARLYLDHAQGDEVHGPALGLELYYELRWRAAKAFGFVDEKRWQRCLLEDLLSDGEFLDRVVLGAAAELERGPVRDHLAEILREGGHPGALRAAALLMPDELARAIGAGEWRPGSSAEWRALLEEIDRRRSERAAKPLLEIAFREVRAVEPLAGRLLLRAGALIPWLWVGERIVRGTPQERSALVEACGDRGDPERIPDLVDLLEKRADLGIFGAGIVALARLGHERSLETLGALLKGPATAQRDAVVRALAGVLHDRRMLRFADRALLLEDLDGALRYRLELGFATNGRRREREGLRAALAAGPGDPRRLEAVRALSSGADAADLAALRELFPVEVEGEGEGELNVDLALALVRQEEGESALILRAALWGDSWNRSVIAGGLIARAGSLAELVSELDSPPPQASERDLRRVGFAIGEWGGLSALELLARSRPEGDPALQGALLGALSTRGR